MKNNQNKIDEINKELLKECSLKQNQLESCDNHKGCDCPTNDNNNIGLVDFVILIDSSSTMQVAIQAVSVGVTQAIKAAKKNCKAKVKATWLWVDSREPGSSNISSISGSSGNFTHSHQKYLEDVVGASGPFYHDINDGVPSSFQPLEKGAAAIADISKFFNWRKKACRSILYISDTKITGYGSNAADNDAAVNLAIPVATSNSVTVFAHRIDHPSWNGPSFPTPNLMTTAEIDEDYHNLCNATGGVALTGGLPTTETYSDLALKAICECKKGCKHVEKPELKPCISISWGDSECDCLESNDLEVFCLTICNCTSNITFRDLTIGCISVTDINGKPIPTLPDGTPSVQIIPKGPHCFGDIPPCKKGEKSCISRQFVLLTKGAVNGEYKIKVESICYDLSFSYNEEACYKLKICKD